MDPPQHVVDEQTLIVRRRGVAGRHAEQLAAVVGAWTARERVEAGRCQWCDLRAKARHRIVVLTRARSQPAMNAHPLQSAPARGRPWAACGWTPRRASSSQAAASARSTARSGTWRERLLFDEVRGDDARGRRAPTPRSGASTQRSSTGSSNGAPVRRPPSLRMRTSWAPSGELEREAEVADEIDAERLECGPPAEIDAAPGPLAELGEVAPHRGAVQGALLGSQLPAARRTPRAARPRRRGGRAGRRPRAGSTTAKRASAVRLACCLPPACSRARRRRHRSSARRSIAGVTRGRSSICTIRP